MYKYNIPLFETEDYRAKGKKSEEKIKEEKNQRKKSTNGMQMPTMWKDTIIILLLLSCPNWALPGH